MEPSSLRMLNGFENVVLEAAFDNRPCILRLTHSSHRSKDQVEAELDWIDFLAGHGASVCVPLRSRTGALTEYIETEGDGFIAAAFEKAPGGLVLRDDWTPAMTFNRGALVGRLHSLTRDYQPPSKSVCRSQWYDEYDFVRFRDHLSEEDGVVADRFEELIGELRAIPTDRDSYGLCHTDAHTGNIFFDGDRPTLFDFDDSAYDFFISDLAISLFYALWKLPARTDARVFARDFMHQLLAGYRTEYGLDNRWIDRFPAFLKRREIVLYVALHRGFDPADFNDWCRAYVNEHRPRIIDRTPFIDLDWSEFELA